MSKKLHNFNHHAEEIFAVLWYNFPIEQVIKYQNRSARLPENFWGDVNLPDAKSAINVQVILDGTFSFLNKKGYIRYKKVLHEDCAEVRLTKIISSSKKTECSEVTKQ